MNCSPHAGQEVTEVTPPACPRLCVLAQYLTRPTLLLLLPGSPGWVRWCISRLPAPACFTAHRGMGRGPVSPHKPPPAQHAGRPSTQDLQPKTARGKHRGKGLATLVWAETLWVQPQHRRREQSWADSAASNYTASARHGSHGRGEKRPPPGPETSSSCPLQGAPPSGTETNQTRTRQGPRFTLSILFIHWKDRVRESERERERERLLPLVHSANSCNSLGWEPGGSTHKVTKRKWDGCTAVVPKSCPPHTAARQAAVSLTLWPKQVAATSEPHRMRRFLCQEIFQFLLFLCSSGQARSRPHPRPGDPGCSCG
nr:uncharacterized protein LOC127492642 [Oryctolagus cuniculus]